MTSATVLNVSEARDRLSDLMGRAFYRNETFVIARKGTPMVVLMSIKEYNALQVARSEQATGYDPGRYEVQVKEWAEQYETARATFEIQHPNLDQEEAERVELTALLDELEHPRVLPSLDDVTEDALREKHPGCGAEHQAIQPSRIAPASLLLPEGADRE